MCLDSIVIRLDQTSPSQTVDPVKLSFEVIHKDGLEVYRVAIVAIMERRECVKVGEMVQMGWEKEQFIVSIEDGHEIIFTRLKPVYQG